MLSRKKKNRNTLFVRTYKYFPLFYSPATEVFLDCERARLVCILFQGVYYRQEQHQLKCLRLRWEYPMGHKTAKRLMKSAYSYRIKYYRPMYREIYWQMSLPIYRPMSRPIYRWSIGEASVKYWWSIDERQLYRPIRVSVDISVDTPLIYLPILNRVSTV